MPEMRSGAAPGILGSVLICLIILVGFILSKQFLPHPHFVLWNIDSNLKRAYKRHPVDSQRFAVLIEARGTNDVIGESRLMKVWTKAGAVGSATYNIESNEIPSCATGDREGLFLRFGGEGTNVQFPYHWLIYRKKIEVTKLVDLGMVTKFPLAFGRIEDNGHIRCGGKHFRVELDVLGNRVPHISYREVTFRDCLPRLQTHGRTATGPNGRGHGARVNRRV